MSNLEHSSLRDALNFAIHDSDCLPGRKSHAKFAPAMAFGRHFGPPRWNSRHAAVLVLLQPDGNGDWQIPYTVRNRDLRDHAGQVSFPGGVLENGETSPQAAVREFEEELGVETHQVEILGRLTPLYLYNSNFWVEPWLALTCTSLELTPNQSEVDDCFLLPSRELLNRRNYKTTKVLRGDFGLDARCIAWQCYTIWGATAMITSELIDLIHPIWQTIFK